MHLRILCTSRNAYFTRPPPFDSAPNAARPHAFPDPLNRRRSLLLLVLNQLNIILRNLLVILRQPIRHILTNITLDRNLLASRRRLRHARPRRELLSKLLCRLLQIQPKGF
jgi:hypothetical protein